MTENGATTVDHDAPVASARDGSGLHDEPTATNLTLAARRRYR